MDIVCNGGRQARGAKHRVWLEGIRTLTRARKTLPAFGWVNDPEWGWTCPEHRGRAPATVQQREELILPEYAGVEG